MINRVYLIFALSISLISTLTAQDLSKLIPNRNYTKYKLPETKQKPTSFNLLGDIQIEVPLMQGIYNANLGLWTTLPGSDVMSHCQSYEIEYYLITDSLAREINLISVKNNNREIIEKIPFGNYRLKKVIGTKEILIYGNNGIDNVIYKVQEDSLNIISTFATPIYDIVATKDQILFVSNESLYTIIEGKPKEIYNLGILLTGITYGPRQTLFISTLNGVFNFTSFEDKNPKIVSKLLNGVLRYQGEYLILLDYLTNSIYKIEYK